MKAYLDNNIFIDIEKKTISTSDLLNNVSKGLTEFYYSASHLQEANEITAESEEEYLERLKARFRTISNVTNNNYLFQEQQNKEIRRKKEKPSIVFHTISGQPSAQSAMKQFMSIVSEEQKAEFRKQLKIDPRKINNYSPSEVIEHINSKSDFLNGLSFLGLIEKATELYPAGSELGLQNRMAGIFEMLDMFGYWKDKFNEKSNYARLWDASHTFFSTYCDFFVSNDRRTRNKAKVVFEIYNIKKTKIVSSYGTD